MKSNSRWCSLNSSSIFVLLGILFPSHFSISFAFHVPITVLIPALIGILIYALITSAIQVPTPAPIHSLFSFSSHSHHTAFQFWFIFYSTSNIKSTPFPLEIIVHNPLLLSPPANAGGSERQCCWEEAPRLVDQTANAGGSSRLKLLLHLMS